MRPADVAGLAAAVGLGLVWWYAQQSAAALEGMDSGSDGDVVGDVVQSVKSFFGSWAPPAQYAGLIADAEARNGIPAGLLARLLYQECRWRQDIITGRKVSPVGAVGIAQFMPATAREWGVDPLDVESSINGAGRYLAWLRRKVSSWAEALAAYNWGIGNVQKKGLSAAPAETRNYYTSILNDTGYGVGLA